VEEICRLLRVFPQMIGYSDKTATYASAEQFFIAHVIHSLGPWIERFEQVISRDLLTEDEVSQGYFAKFNVEGLLRGDAASRSTYYKNGIIDGWLVRNEARSNEDMNPIDGLDEPLQPLNMVTVSQAKAQGRRRRPGSQGRLRSREGHRQGRSRTARTGLRPRHRRRPEGDLAGARGAGRTRNSCSSPRGKGRPRSVRPQ
jgi:hypothetical protein